jgi:hypothetical protein
MKDKRWDQALFLAMSFLKKDSKQSFLDEILTADLAAAARASHYLEAEQERIIDEITLRAANQSFATGLLGLDVQFRLKHQLELLPYKVDNIAALTRLSERSESIGGVGAGVRFKIAPKQRKGIIDEIVHSHDDWNYVQSFAAIAKPPFWSDDDLDYLLDQLSRKTSEHDGSTAFGEILYESAEPSKLLSWCKNYIHDETAAKYALIAALRKFDNRNARSILFDLVISGQHEAIYALCSNLEFHAETYEADELPVDARIAHLLAQTLSSEHGEWAISLARKLIDRNTDWKQEFEAVHIQGSSARLILSIISAENSSLPRIVASALAEIENLDDYSARVLGKLDFWKSAPDSLILTALSTRNPSLAGAVLGQAQGRKLPLLSIHTLDWWLDWEEECIESEVRPVWWCGYMIGRFINDGTDDIRAMALARFNDTSKKEFERIGRLVFREGASSVSTEQFSETALGRLLNEGGSFDFSAAVLGVAATEEFVTTVLLPLLKENSSYIWIHEAVEVAGNRHNRRYFLGNTGTRN